MCFLLKRGGSMEGVLPEVKRDADFRASRDPYRVNSSLSELRESPEQWEATDFLLNVPSCSGVLISSQTSPSRQERLGRDLRASLIRIQDTSAILSPL